MAMKSLGWRVVALVYAWTIGVVIMAAILLAATLYAIVDITNRLVEGGSFWKEFTLFMAVSSLLSWQNDLHRYAFLGDGAGFDPTPDVSFG